MLTEQGLGKERRIIKDFDLFVNDINCYKDKSLSLPTSYTKHIDIQDFHQNVILHFRTPLRMKQNNVFVKSQNLTLHDIGNSIYQRQVRILGREYEKFPHQISGEIAERDLFFKELTRLSNRQKTTMNLGGIMGQITLQGLNKETYEILKIGEILGVGKQCVFGLGKITLEVI
nr:CRISPR system precrRNA processing endoribonuclease RAMP protein Cas6 [Helicobacter cinaedi]